MTQAFNLSQLANKVNTSGQLDASTGLVNITPVANGGTGKSSNSSGTILLGAGAAAMTELTGAATNDVVAWNGSTWISTPGNSVAGGDYIMRAYVSPATYVKPTNVKAIKVTVVGAGGAGGPATSTNTAVSCGGGGGGGGAAIRYLDVASIPASPIAITAGAGTNSFGAFASATAGSTGGAGVASNTQVAVGGAGGSGSSGTVNVGGSGGEMGVAVSGSFAVGGTGGGSVLGGGGTGVNIGTGNAGKNYGGGGAGGARQTLTGTNAGASGAPGIVIVEEFY